MSVKLIQLQPSTICKSTESSKALMATVFESVKSNATTIMPSPKIVNHAFLSFIETVGMHCKVAIRYSPIQALYTTINQFFHSLHFIFKLFQANIFEIWIWNNIEKKVIHIHLGLIYSLNWKFYMKHSLFSVSSRLTCIYSWDSY